MKQVYEVTLEQTKQILDENALSSCEDILFISKSIGTIIAAEYAKESDLKIRHIFFTPLDKAFQKLPEE